jgi:hypothetical protein
MTMSVFTDSSDQSKETTDTNTQSQTEDWVAKVAMEKGEKFRDPNELAKGYAHSQEHIANLTRQIEEMREDLGKQDYMKEVLERFDADKAKPTGGEQASSNTTSTNDSGHKPEVSVDEIKKLIAETLTQQEAQNTARQNLEETDRQLEAAFGTDAKAKVQERAAQLGMSPERMKQLAEESPSAFMSLMGEAPQKETNQMPQSQVNTSQGFNTNSGRKDWAYYQKLRKENSKLYYSPRIQNEMLSQRQQLGEAAFYNR